MNHVINVCEQAKTQWNGVVDRRTKNETDGHIDRRTDRDKWKGCFTQNFRNTHRSNVSLVELLQDLFTFLHTK